MSDAIQKTRIRKGDKVVVVAGSCKGESGTVDRVDFEKSRVFVGGVNVRKRHQKPTGGQTGGIVDKVMSIHISNVAFADPKSGKPTRLGFRVEDDKKVRFAKASGQTV
ncbi:MAG: 50S ribosomal protein L24 [Oligoflexales bacterium]